MKRVEIHCQEPNGRVCVINRFPIENNEIASSSFRADALSTKLLRYASLGVIAWQSQFPSDRVYLVITK